MKLCFINSTLAGNKRCSSADVIRTSSCVGAVTSLILLLACTAISSGTLNLLNTNNTYATTSSITLSVTDIISLDIMPTASGTFATSDTTTPNISIKTDNYTGYTLGIKASTDNFNALSTTGDNTGSTIPSITSPISENDYRTNTGGNYNNTWGYRPSKLDSTDNTNYLQAPTSAETATILDTTSTANPTTANTYNIAIGARVNNNTAPGSYTNTFIITAIANATPYTITYNANGGSDTVSNMPSNVNDATYADTVTLSSNTPTRTGHTFAGWCTSAVAADASCTGTSYASSSNWVLDQTASTNNLTLYARWTINSYTCTQQYRLQNADASYPSSYTNDGTKSVKYGATCSYTKSADYYTSATGTCTMTTDGCTAQASLPRSTYALTINRNTTYISSVSGAGTYRWGQSVSISATPASGGLFNGWSVSSGSTGSFASASNASTTYTMPQGASTIYANGKSSTTTFAQAYAAAGKTQTSGYYKMQDMTNSICSSVTAGQSATLRDIRSTGYNYTVAKIGSLCWMTTNLALGKNTTIALTNSDTNLNGSLTSYTLPARGTYGTFSEGKYVWGTDSTTCGNNSPCYDYYSYAAATAGTNPSSDAAASDICPKGWRLPTSSELTSLKNSYTTGTALTSSPFLGVYAGYYVYNRFYNGGLYGFYWSSTANGSGYAYYLSFSTSANVISDNKAYGRSVRCVAKQ